MDPQAARMLGVSRYRLLRRLEKYGMPLTVEGEGPDAGGEKD